MKIQCKYLSGGFKLHLADPYVWLKPAVKADGTKYNEDILVYVDDQLSVSGLPKVDNRCFTVETMGI